VIEHAVHEVQTSQPDRLQATIRGLDFESFFGHIKFDKYGRNGGGASLAIQFRRVAGIIREILLWPPIARNSVCWPFPAWPPPKS